MNRKNIYENKRKKKLKRITSMTLINKKNNYLHCLKCFIYCFFDENIYVFRIFIHEETMKNENKETKLKQ